MKKSRHLLLYGKEHYKEIIFTDEKIFTAEQTFNKQSDKVYTWPSKEARELVSGIEQDLVMVWWEVSYDGINSIHSCEIGAKTETRNYQRDILTNVVESLKQTMFQNRPWIFQQE